MLCLKFLGEIHNVLDILKKKLLTSQQFQYTSVTSHTYMLCLKYLCEINNVLATCTLKYKFLTSQKFKYTRVLFHMLYFKFLSFDFKYKKM